MFRNLVAVSLGLLLCIAPALALASSLEVRADASGSAVTAEVVLNGSMTASGVQFALTYDDTRLQLTGYENGALFGGNIVNETVPGQVRLIWYSTDGVPLSGENTVLTLSFTPRQDGDTSIRFDPAAMPAMVVDNNLNTLDTQTTNATVTVNGASAVAAASTAKPEATVAFFPTNSPLPQLTPAALTPTPLPPAQLATPTPTPAAQGEARVQTTVSATPASSEAQTAAAVATSTTPSAPEQTPIATSPAQPAALQHTPAPATQPQIEILDTESAAFPLSWVLGGAALLLCIGVILYRRFQ